ncbi:MAG: enoyl-CoA hydratase-related protein [Chitinophagaceae bacterium]|nr:enoyl-CoA hydratase-related protein [Chitinophagaceae bacterium]
MQSLSLSFHDHTLVIAINRPEKLNALNKVVIEELGTAISDVYNNGEIRSVIITGSGTKAFVAGADISEFGALDAAGGKAMAEKGQKEVFDKIENCPKPVIAAVNGFALGGGCELAMACHFRIASANARFGQPEINLGLIPGYGGTRRLPRLIGKGRAMEMLMTGKMIDAPAALQYGLVNEVTAEDDLMSKALAICAVINTKAPLALAGVVRATNAAFDENKTETEIFGQLFDTADAKEGAAAFLEKRQPVFKGA